MIMFKICRMLLNRRTNVIFGHVKDYGKVGQTLSKTSQNKETVSETRANIKYTTHFLSYRTQTQSVASNLHTNTGTINQTGPGSLSEIFTQNKI